MPNHPTIRRPFKSHLPVQMPEHKLKELLYEAYMAGWNKEMAGFWRHPSTLETTGEPHTLAQMWSRYKTE